MQTLYACKPSNLKATASRLVEQANSLFLSFAILTGVGVTLLVVGQLYIWKVR